MGGEPGRESPRPAAPARKRTRALDPRLLEHARATRAFIGTSVALGSADALMLFAQAWLLTTIVCDAFLGGRGLAHLRASVIVLLAVVLARAALAWAAELAAARASAAAKSQLRGGLLGRAAEVLAYEAGEERTGELAVLATRGIDALDAYFAQYLPQLFLSVIAPIVVVTAVLLDDWVSALIIVATIPLIPLFMALVGAATGERTERELRILQKLAGHFLDVVTGLTTLKVFGRARAQTAAIARVTDQYRQSAIATLRVTFLSSLILELVATLSVAIVAVAIGLRLLDGTLGLRAGLFALVLAPEAYLPLRRLGANYHASAEGLAAADQAFEIVQAPARAAVADGASANGTPAQARARTPDPARAEIVLDEVTVAYPGRSEPALAGLSLSVRPGEILALAGASGCGKSTVIAVLLGLVTPSSGSARIGGAEIAELDPAAWHERLAWLPQRPHLFRATVAENVRLGRAGASDAEVQGALEAAGLGAVVRGLPAGVETLLGEGGAGLSAGERQRLALARVLIRDRPLLLLDEPTANLDGDTERDVLEAIRRGAQGRTVVVAAHRPALLEMADRVVSLTRPEVLAR